MSFAARFKAGSDIAGDLLNTYDAAKRKQAMAEIAGATEITAYGPDDAAQIDAAAKAVGPDGKPYYTVGNDAAGNYTITPNFQNETGDAPTAYAPTTLAAKGVSFLGKNYNAPLTETQMTGARQQAMAGVMERGGDVEGAMRYRQEAQRGVLAGKQLEQADLQIAQSKLQITQAERSGKREDKVDAVTAILEGVDKEAGTWMDARLTGADGTKRAATIDDHMATTQFRANKLVEAGRSSEAGALMKDFNAQAFAKIQLETATRTEAIKMASGALAAGDLNAVKDFYNKFVPDGAHVTNMTRDASGRITIERTSTDGRPMPPQTLKDTVELSKALTAFSDPMALYNFSQNEFKNNLLVNADKRAAAHLGIAQTTAGLTNKLTQANIDEKNLAVADKKALGDLRDAYGVAVDSGDAKAIDTAAKKIHIFNRSGKGGEAASAFAQKVDLLMRANPGMSLAQVTDKAMAKAEQSADAYYAEILKPSNMGISIGPEKAAEFTRSAYPGWRAAAPSGAGAAAAAGGTPVQGREASGKVTNLPEYKTRALAEAAAKAGQLKTGDRVLIGGRIATLN